MQEINTEGRLPYYLCISKDIYEILQEELGRSVLKNKYLKDGKIVIDIFEEMECVIFGHDSVKDYISVKSIAKKNEQQK